MQVPAISKHLDNIYESGELTREATISILETVQIEGNREVKRNIEYFNLDAIISVGYWVNSREATQFRIWATNTLKEYLIKGFILDDDRLKNGRYFGKDYFRELLESGQFGQANAGYTNKLPIFLQNVALIMTPNRMLPQISLPRFKTNSILP